LESLHDNQSKGPPDWNGRGRRRGFCFGSILIAAISQGLPAETVARRYSPYRRLRAKHSGFPPPRITAISPRRKGQDGCAYLVDSIPGNAINTHPILVVAAAECFRGLGAKDVIVAEGPGHQRDTQLVLCESGYESLLRENRIRFETAMS